MSGELSLQIKAGLVKVEGAGKYLSERKNDENSSEILVMLKCQTVSSRNLERQGKQIALA